SLEWASTNPQPRKLTITLMQLAPRFKPYGFGATGFNNKLFFGLVQEPRGTVLMHQRYSRSKRRVLSHVPILSFLCTSKRRWHWTFVLSHNSSLHLTQR